MAALAEEASSAEEDAVAAALGSNDEACSIAAWYDAHKNVTFKTVLVPLPVPFVEWLRSDGPCVLPRTKRGARVTARTHNRDDDCELSDSDDDGAAPHFPAVEAAIDDAIAAEDIVAIHLAKPNSAIQVARDTGLWGHRSGGRA